MAKRKRLELPNQSPTNSLETTSVFPTHSRMPIAEVAGSTATRAALDEVTHAMASAEAEGRVVRKLPLGSIDLGHLNRDRMVLDREDMQILIASMSERGQQTPIEVQALPDGRYGLISGLRRLHALEEMGQSEVLAFVRTPESAAASYVAMVEENEIRAGLSFYERANIVVQSVETRVYPSTRAAVKGLFAHVTSAKRSKILRFVILRDALGPHLSFPAAIPEKLGLALASAIKADKAVARRLGDVLRKFPPVDATAERKALERALKLSTRQPTTDKEIVPGIKLSGRKGKLILSGASVDANFEEALRHWIATR